MNNNSDHKQSKIRSNINILYRAASVVYIFMIILYIATWFTDRPRYGTMFYGMSIIIFSLKALKGDYELFQSLEEKILGPKGTKALIILLLIVGLVSSTYFWHEFQWLIYERAGSANAVDKTFGVITLVLATIVLYSYAGPILIAVGFLLVLYCLFGSYIPGFLKFPGFSFPRIVEISITEIQRGFFGNLMQMGATIVAMFVLLAGCVEGLGMFDVILKASLLLAKKSKHLITQSAVLASAVMGMFSGSGAGNVAGTGSFTIPLMKKYNVSPAFEGAIEAVASAGGQIMPPIMGAAVFLMAEYLGTPYVTLAFMGIVPAILYFSGVGFSVFNISKNIDIKIPENMGQQNYSLQGSQFKRLFIDGIPLISTLMVLIYLMGVMQFDALIAGYFSFLFLLALAFVWGLPKIRTHKNSFILYLKRFVNQVVNGFETSAGTIMEISLMLGFIEIFVTLLSTSGVALKMNMLILSLAREQEVLILFLSAIICIMLGCVVSTVAVYILAMVTVVPALLRLGIEPAIAHFYVFWFAIAGLITPPVAGNVIAACRIAKSSFWETAKEALKIGIGIFLVPVGLITHPEILIYNASTPLTTLVFLVSLWTISVSLYARHLWPHGGKEILILRTLSFFLALMPIFSSGRTIMVISFAIMVIGNLILITRYRKLNPLETSQLEQSL